MNTYGAYTIPLYPHYHEVSVSISQDCTQETEDQKMSSLLKS
jgi:hypothetical protein